MDSSEHIKELFKQLVKFSFDEDNIDEKQIIAEKLISCDINYEKKLYAILLKFVNKPSTVLLSKLRYYIVSSSQWLAASQILNLAANLVNSKQMSQQEAASLLSNFSFDQRALLTKEELNVVELAELVNEDFCEGFINVEEDDIFIKKLSQFS